MATEAGGALMARLSQLDKTPSPGGISRGVANRFVLPSRPCPPSLG